MLPYGARVGKGMRSFWGFESNKNCGIAVECGISLLIHTHFGGAFLLLGLPHFLGSRRFHRPRKILDLIRWTPGLYMILPDSSSNKIWGSWASPTARVRITRTVVRQQKWAKEPGKDAIKFGTCHRNGWVMVGVNMAFLDTLLHTQAI